MNATTKAFAIDKWLVYEAYWLRSARTCSYTGNVGW